MSSIRAERGYTTSVVILRGQDVTANEVLFKQRAVTDGILVNLQIWPEGLTTNGVKLTTPGHLKDMLNAFRGQVASLTVEFNDVLDFYSKITKLLIYWLLVIRQFLQNMLSLSHCVHNFSKKIAYMFSGCIINKHIDCKNCIPKNLSLRIIYKM